MMKCRERSHTSFIGLCLTFGRIYHHKHISSLWPLPLNSPQNWFSSQENIIFVGLCVFLHFFLLSIKVFRDTFAVTVCKVSSCLPIEYYLQLLPLPVREPGNGN